MKPTIGRIVTVLGLDSVGVREHPAMITRVLTPGSDTIDGAVKVNLAVFQDTAREIQPLTVDLYDTHEAAVAGQSGETDIVAHWPELTDRTAPK